MTSMRAENASRPSRCTSCPIRHRGICGALTDEDLQHFSQIAYHRTYQPGDIILSSEEESDFFAAVHSGVVKLTKVLIDGRQQVVGLLLPPDFLGRTFGKSNPYFAEAASRVELCCFPHARFEHMLDDFSGLKQRLLEQTLNELDSTRDWMVWLGRKTAEERVASLFLMLATRWMCTDRDEGTGSQTSLFELYLKRDEIADFLGLTYETVCRQISSLKQKGIVQFSGTRRFSVPDISALTKIAG